MRKKPGSESRLQRASFSRIHDQPGNSSLEKSSQKIGSAVGVALGIEVDVGGGFVAVGMAVEEGIGWGEAVGLGIAGEQADARSITRKRIDMNGRMQMLMVFTPFYVECQPTHVNI